MNEWMSMRFPVDSFYVDDIGAQSSQIIKTLVHIGAASCLAM